MPYDAFSINLVNYCSDMKPRSLGDDTLDLIATIRPWLETPATAGAVIAAFNRLGSWLDREIEAEQMSALRTYLKSGRWIDKYQDFIEFLLSVYNRVYGTNALSAKSAFRAVQLSLLPFAIISGWDLLIGGQFWFFLSWETFAFGLLPRFILSVIADIVNIAGSRLTLSGLRASPRFIWKSSVIALDLLRAALVVVITNVAGLWVFQALYTFYLTNSVKRSMQGTFLNDLSYAELRVFFHDYWVSLRNFHEADSILSLTSLVPTALTAVVMFAMFLRYLVISFPISLRFHASDLQYTKPFTLILSIAGAVVYVVYFITAALLKHWFL